MRGSRRRVDEEEGLSLVELLVAMFIFGIVMLIFTQTLASIQSAVVHQDNLARTNDQARLALEQLDREIRSGNVLYDPSTESDPYYMVRVYTQSNSPTLGGYSCVLWKIDDEGQLLTRHWPEGDATEATEWRGGAPGVVNKKAGGPALPPGAGPPKGGRAPG